MIAESRVMSRARVLVFLIALAGVICAQPSERSVWDGVYTAEQAKRGEALYANNCASCHGSALGGW